MVLDAQPAVEPLGELAVVDVHGDGREAQLSVQALKGRQHHQRGLDVVVLGQGLVTDDVDVSLGELAIAALLRTFTTPHLLDLVATEREVQVAGVLQHVAGEGNGEVEVQAQTVLLGPRVMRVSVQSIDDVDLLVDLSLAGELLHGLDGTGMDRRETMKLEGLLKDPGHMVLHHLS